nr:hypothetical protein [Pedobacter sp. ASV19]
MDPFTICLHGVRLTVYPQESGVYKVFRGSNKLAELYHDDSNSDNLWETRDWVDQNYVDEIGKEIEEHEYVGS